MTVDYELLGRNIKYYRNKKKMKQATLAELVDVTPEHISHIERCHTKASMSLLFTIAEVLDTDVYSLAGIETPNIKQDAELMELFRDTDPAQRKLCLEICRAALKYSPGS